jgi:ankyrin repeat protein
MLKGLNVDKSKMISDAIKRRKPQTAMVFIEYLSGDLQPSLVILASSYGYADVLELLLSKNVDPSSDENLALRDAVSAGYTEIVKILLRDKRVDPSVRDNEAFRFASILHHFDIVKLLLCDNRVTPALDFFMDGHYDEEILDLVYQSGRLTSLM